MKNFVNIKNIYGILDSNVMRLSGAEMNEVEIISD